MKTGDLVKVFNREELLERLADGDKDAILEYDLRGADLRYADLKDANLAGANLTGANLRSANLTDANLRDANLRGANIRYANLGCADLTGASLRSANLTDADLTGVDLTDADPDFSSWPLWCGSLLANVDDRQVKQLLYHTLSVVKHSTNVSQDLKDKLLTNSNIEIAREFHRAQECNKL